MTYTDFSLETVESGLGIAGRIGTIFPDLAPSPVPDWLKAILGRGLKLALISEKARAEYIIAPILLAVRELSGDRISILSGQRLDVDPTRGLSGECDFILEFSDPLPRLRAPLVAIVEAKKNDIDAGLGQCAAQLVAARAFTDRANRSVPSLFGCVTTGEVWQFLRLVDETVTIDPNRFFLDNVGMILATFHEALRPSWESD